MSSLSKCLKKMGLSEHEGAILRGSAQRYITADGIAAQQAAIQAVEDYLEQLTAERLDIVSQIEAQGGVVSAPDPNPEQRSISRVAESQAPDTAKALETGDAGVAPSREDGLPDAKPIADFGKKLEGARKDYAQAYKDALADAAEVDVAAEPLSKSWPEPDYDKLLESGADAWSVAFSHAARDEVPTKPQQAWKLKRWVDTVTLLREVTNKIMSGEINQTKARDLLSLNEKLRDVSDRAELYTEVGHEKSLKGIRIRQGSYGVYESVQYNPPKIIWSVEGKVKSTVMSRWPTTYASGDTREQAIENFKRKWAEPSVEEVAKKVDFDIFSRRGEKAFFIGKKIGSNVVELKSGFATVKEARQWKAENQSELETLLERIKEVPNERRESNAPRVGEDHRNGADVTPERFAEAFGFRGGQFGNTMPQDERQSNLNEAYDALMDLAAVIGIPPKALSLNGELGLAFGARGRGGKNAPKAHYEADETGAVTDSRVVINLTRARGAGSLAHEWFHAVDNYFARMRGEKGGFVTEKPHARGEGVRPEMIDAFKRIKTAIEAGTLVSRSKKLDQTRTKPYWGTGLEMAARSFESYIVAKLQDQGASNDYLANIVSEDYWNAAAALGMEKEDTYPYPAAAEVPAIRAAFDEFFATVQTKETDKGVAMYDTGWEFISADTPVDRRQLKKDLRELASRIAPMAKVELPDQIIATILGEERSVAGSHTPGLVSVIKVAIETARDKPHTLRHETIHALKSMGLFTESEWRALETYAPVWRKRFGTNERYKHLSNREEKLNEEAIADAYGAWGSGQAMPRGLVERLFERIQQFINALGNLLRGYGFQSASGIFEKIESGAMAKRASPSARSYVELLNEQAYALGSKSWDAPEPSKMDNFIYTLQDKQVDTKRVMEAIRKTGKAITNALDVYLQEELYHGRTAKRVQDFINEELKPLITEIAMRKVSMEDFQKYLHARHAEERNQQIARINPDLPDGGSGMDTQDARDYLTNLDPKQKAAFDALAKRVDSINAKTRQALVASGLESQDTIDAWEAAYKYYVPLQREDMEGAPGIGQGFSVKGPASKRATGSKRNVVDILANVAQQREKAIVRGEKNRVANALVGLVTANPNDEFWKVDQPPKIKYVDPRTGLVASTVDPLYKSRDNVITARAPDASGEVIEHAIIFNDGDERAARMAKALKNLDMDDLGTVLTTSAKITRYFASVNTQYNPIFGVVNLTRDTQGALFNLTTTPIKGKQAEVLQNMLSALKGIYIDLRDTRAGKTPTSTWAQLWEEFQSEGGQTAYRDMFRTSNERGESINREIARVTEGKAKQVGRAVFDWLSDYNSAMENATRLAVYKVAKENGISNEQAASIAKNITVNFNRKGQITTQAGSLYAFFNASVQGTSRLIQTLNGPSGRKIIAGGLTLGVMQALALSAAGFDEDEPPEFVRERNLIIPIGGKKYITIPMPLGLHFIPNLARIPTEFALSGFRNPGKRVGHLFGLFIDAFNPVGGGGSLLQALTPTVADPIAALAENKDWTGKPIARDSHGQPTPGHMRAKDTATAFSKVVSQSLNWISGGTQHKPGLFSPTPDQIDYLVGQITGGVGRELVKAEQLVSSRFTGEDLPTHKIPLLGRFYGTSEEASAQANTFYKNLKSMAEHEAEIKGRRKAGEPTVDYLRDNPEARLYQQANHIEREVAKLRRRKREMMDKDASRESIKLIEEQITIRMKKLNESVKRTRSLEPA